MNLAYLIYEGKRRAGYFASWARPKNGDLNTPRKRYLADDERVVWNIGEENGACADHIEMAGFKVASIISYGKDNNGALRLHRHVTIPTLRVQPNETGCSFGFDIDKPSVQIKIGGANAVEKPQEISIKGNLSVASNAGYGVKITRTFTPAVNQPALIEKVVVENGGKSDVQIELLGKTKSKTLLKALTFGDKKIISTSACSLTDKFNENAKINEKITLKAGESHTHYCVYYALHEDDKLEFSIADEIAAREAFTNEVFTSLGLETPIRELNAQFAHCVLRGSESIYETKNGLMHGPGGGGYYAALWTNDQCEYANPFFPFSGYKKAIEQCVNCYTLYGDYMDKTDTPFKEKRALVTSIISEGDGFWNGAKDRGDGSMYAYGLSRFLLEMSDKELINKFWENLVWCLDFAISRKNEHGVIASDSDELENRFESADANLFTSCITYDAFENAAILADIVGDTKHNELWLKERAELKKAIEKYFGRNVEGFETYQYYDGNDKLRSWICMPLTVDIFDRADETVKALYSPKLYENGMMRTVSDHGTTWDRSLLFALRGTFLAGKADIGIEQTVNYCKHRLIGTHAPYAFEAYPEGNRAHLAAESILFARIVTEGLMGLRAVGLKKLRIKPQLSEKCPYVNLKGLKLFSLDFDVLANESGITVVMDGREYHTENKECVFDFNIMNFE